MCTDAEVPSCGLGWGWGLTLHFLQPGLIREGFLTVTEWEKTQDLGSHGS